MIKKSIKQFTQIFLFLVPVFLTPVALAGQLELSILEIGKRIGTQIKERQAKKLAVFSFSNLNGYQSALGDFIAEELITALFSEGNFDIVERRELDRILKEYERYTSGNFDRETIAELQKLLGIDVLITGTITDLGERIKINSRAISVETGKVFAAASVSVDRDSVIEKLMFQQSSNNSFLSTGEEQGLVNQPSSVFYKNDMLHVFPTGVIVDDERRNVRITTQFRNLTNAPLYLGHSGRIPSRYTDEGASTELGDFFDLSISGIAQVQHSHNNKNSYTLIEPNSHINVLWETKLKGIVTNSIKGSDLTVRSKFSAYTQTGVKRFSVQLTGIKLN